jgi:Cu/Ag efflux pump CusA
LTRLIGAVTLVFGHGTRSKVCQPLGYAIIGGLLVSQFLTVCRMIAIRVTIAKSKPKIIRISSASTSSAAPRPS